MKRLPSIVQPARQTVESYALYFGAACFIVTAVIALCLFWNKQIPIFGLPSSGAIGSLFALFAGFIGFMTAYTRLATFQTYEKRLPYFRRWLKRSALALAHATVFFLISVTAFYIIQQAFKGLLLDHWSSAIIVGTVSGLAGYCTYLMGARVTSNNLSIVLAMFLLGGTLTSMITAENPEWWMIHFSSLGMGDSASATAFNVTLVVGGIVVAGLADTIANDFAKLQTTSKPRYIHTNIHMVRAMLVFIGVLLAGVGLFPFDMFPTIHNVCAIGMIVVFMVLVGMLPRLVSDFPRAFFVFSFSLFASVLACYWLWVGVGYLNLTALELLCAGIVFSWLIVFVRHISAGLEDNASTAA